MSEAALAPTIKVGATLLDAAGLALRYWLVGLVAVAAMAGMFLGLLDLLAWCFGPGRDRCVGTAFFTLSTGQQKSFVADAVVALPLVAAFLVSVVVLRLFYLGARPIRESGAHDRPAELRLGRFVARAALVFVMVSVPRVLLDSGYMHASWMLYPEYLSGPVETWGSYVAVKAIGTAWASYMRSRLVLFVPSVVFQRQPEGLSAAWGRTSAARWKLFAIFLLIEFAVFFAQVLFGAFAPSAIDSSGLIRRLSAWSHVDTEFIAALLPTAITYAIVVPFAGLWAAGISIVAYRDLVAIDHARAGVFD